MKLACTTCDKPAMAVKPGSAPKVCAGVTYDRGQPDEAFCWAHWLARFGAKHPDLFEVRHG